MYVFLVFAQVIWPMYVPLAMFLFEKHKKRRRAKAVLLAAGISLSCYTLFCLCYFPAYAEADHHHIMYTVGFGLSNKWYYGLLYFLPTIAAPLISGTKMLRWLGYLFLVS